MAYEYFRLFGTYESLDGGELAEALEDFTGGIAEPLDLLAGGYSADEEKKEQLFLTMDKEMDRNSLMASAIPVSNSLVLPPIKIQLFKHSFTYQGIVIWSSFSLNMKMAPSLSSFKKLYLEEQFPTLWSEAWNLRATAKIKSVIWLCYPHGIKIIITWDPFMP